MVGGVFGLSSLASATAPDQPDTSTPDSSVAVEADGNEHELSEFDGFCAGLVVCPEMVPPSEWLPLVWGEACDPRFETKGDMQRALEPMMGHYNEVARSLTPPDIDYGPGFIEIEATGEVLWEDWVSGFERAMRLRMDAWEQIVESLDEEAASSVTMMLALYAIAEGTSDLPDASVRELSDQAPDLIPDMVIALNWWTKRFASAGATSFSAANSPSAPFHGTKVGRNAPCPCGSGRKHKRCCGGN